MKGFFERHLRLIIWICRIVVGGTFVVSGLAKAIDPWGFIYKIEQYLVVWNVDVSFPLIVGVALMMSGIEFLLGVLVFAGCYRRTAVWAVTAIMLGMLPLTLYIAIANPVTDCGCFGDFIVISNTATFLKNVVLMMLLVLLLCGNRKVDGLFTSYSQWLVAFIAIIYIIIISLWGYNIQPLEDFRPYKVGTSLVHDGEEEFDDSNIVFIYEKDGKQQEFTVDSLPDDTWTYVTRKGEEVNTHEGDAYFPIYDGDDDVAADVINPEGEELILVIPEMKRLDISSTYLINEMYRYIENTGGEMIAVVGADAEGIELWKDLSMATYPIYNAEDTDLKELSRGNISVVYLKDGIIRWKRALSSIDSDYFSNAEGKEGLLEELNYNSRYIFGIFTLIFLALELFLYLLDKSGRILKVRLLRKNPKK